jgi:hypothetical protein
MARRRSQTVVIATRGDLIVERDPERPSGRLLRQGQMEASYVDLADTAWLQFDYLRWIAVVLEVAGARRNLHIGGGACALPRALAAADPDALQEVCEIDGEVLAIAREHLGLRRMPGLRVRHLDGREHLEAAQDASYDAVVIDAFVGARVPPRLVSIDALQTIARVAPLALINVVDNRAAQDVRAIAARLAEVYPKVWAIGGRGGNTVLVGGSLGPQALQRIGARLAADSSPARIEPA